MSGTFMPKNHGWIFFGFMSGTFMPKAHGWIFLALCLEYVFQTLVFFRPYGRGKSWRFAHSCITEQSQGRKGLSPLLISYEVTPQRPSEI